MVLRRAQQPWLIDVAHVFYIGIVTLFYTGISGLACKVKVSVEDKQDCGRESFPHALSFLFLRSRSV